MLLLNKLLIIAMLVMYSSISVLAQDDEYTRQPKTNTPIDTVKPSNKTARQLPETWWQKNKSKISTGGNLGINYYNGWVVQLSPLIAYKFNKYIMLGNTFNFAYYENGYGIGRSVSTYGVSPFARAYILPRIFLHTEYENSYIKVLNTSTPSSYIYNWLAGGGITYPIVGNVYATLSALWVVKTNYPRFYQNPIIRGGIVVGF